MSARNQHEPADELLVAEARRGDATAFDALVRRYQQRVYNALLRMCRHEADALDLAQAAFLRAYERLDRFDGRAGFYTWLFRIAMNLALSHFRQARRRPTVSLDGREASVPRIVSDPSARLEQTERAERVAVALEKLEEDFRAVVVLRDVEGMDYAAIGQVLELPVGTVKSRLFRGRMMLRELLQAGEDVLRESV